MDQRDGRGGDGRPWWGEVTGGHADATPTEAFPTDPFAPRGAGEGWGGNPGATADWERGPASDEDAMTVPLHLLETDGSEDDEGARPPHAADGAPAAPTVAFPAPGGQPAPFGAAPFGAAPFGASTGTGQPFGSAPDAFGPPSPHVSPHDGSHAGGADRPAGTVWGTPAPPQARPDAGTDPQPGAGAPQPGYGQPSAFGQPAGSGQPSGFGQPSAFGQPVGSGQPSGFGQPVGPGQPSGSGQQFGPGPFADPGQAAPTGRPPVDGGSATFGVPERASGHGSLVPITPSGAPSPGSDPRGSDPRGYDPHGYDPTGYPSGPAAERGALDVSRPQQVPVYGLRTVGEHGGQPPFPPHGGAGAPAARRARPALWIWTSVAVVVLLVAGVVAAEFITRAQTAGRIDDLAASIALTTDAGDAVEGPFSAEIVDGGSSLLQAMGGTIDHVHIEAPDQRVDGESLSTTFDLHEVPVGLDGPAGRVDVTLGADPEALLQLLEYEIDTSLTDGLELTSTELSGDALHFEYTSAYGIVVTHDLEIHAEDGKIVLSPTNYTMTLFGYDLDLGDGDPVELGLCADSGLDGTMEDITTESGRFVLTWSVTGAAPTPQGLAEAWSCI